MATSATLSFHDDEESFHVYKHYDGCPGGKAGILTGLKTTLEEKAYGLPNFEANEFAAAYIAANKRGPGDIRLHNGQTSGAAQYHYDVQKRNGELYVKVFHWVESREPIMKGDLDTLIRQVKTAGREGLKSKGLRGDRGDVELGK